MEKAKGKADHGTTRVDCFSVTILGIVGFLVSQNSIGQHVMLTVRPRPNQQSVTFLGMRFQPTWNNNVEPFPCNYILHEASSF